MTQTRMPKRDWQQKRRPRPDFRRERQPLDGPVILYGWHTVKAALENPDRRIRHLWATENAARRLAEEGVTLAGRPRAGAARRHRGTAFARCRPSGPVGRGRSPLRPRNRRPRHHRRRAGARSDHRPAQCRRHSAHGRSVCGRSHRHHRAPQPGGDRRAGEVRLGRARAGADRQRAESRARTCGAQGARLPRGRARQRRDGRSCGDRNAARRSRWCSAPKARACGN